MRFLWYFLSTYLVIQKYNEIYTNTHTVCPCPQSVQETVKKHGADQVQIWRRSFDIPPPNIDESSEFNPAKESNEAVALP